MAENNKEVARAGINRELATLDITLTGAVSRTAISLEEYVKMRTLQGVSLEVIRADLLKDLEEGGRIFGELRNALKPTFAGSVNRFRDIGILAEIGIDTKYRWVAVLVNTCPDCLERHNNIATWADWEEQGLPRTGATVCKEHCKCVLLPAEATELQPIMRAFGG